MREYAVHADYAHIRKYAEADENLVHIIHICIYVFYDLLQISSKFCHQTQNVAEDFF